MSQLLSPNHWRINQSAAFFVVMALLFVILEVFAEPLGAVLDLRRASVLGDGELWRIVSAHIVHLNFAHAALNAVAMLLIGALVYDAASLRRWICLYLLLSVVVSLALIVFMPQLPQYAGASGVLHGLWVFGALAQLPTEKWESLTLLILVAAKLGYEAFAGASLGTAQLIGGHVVTQSHLAGAIGGLLAWWLLRLIDARRASR